MEKYKDSIREYAYCFILGPFFMIIEAWRTGIFLLFCRTGFTCWLPR